jgi:CubicO group peptidase (beta-lactamase class C family)
MHGHVDPRFSRVRDVFADNFVTQGELGASVAVMIDGKLVVDLWDGFADKAKTRPWTDSTLANVFSVTKAWTAICAHRLVDQRKLDLDRPVAAYWPEFAEGGEDGKREVLVAQLLDHTAGLPAIRELLAPDALFDWETMTRALAAETPWWAPGTKHGYHACTYGWLVGEVIRRVSGKSPGSYFRDEIARPLGLDAHIGLEVADDARCADLRFLRRLPGSDPTLAQRLMAAPESMAARAFTNPAGLVVPDVAVSRAWRGAELPSINGHATARANARLYGALACDGELDGLRVLSRESIDRARGERVRGEDAVLGVSTRFGLGFMLSQPEAMFGPNEGAFGHPGMGGALGFADPSSRLGFGYVPNMLGMQIHIDPRATRLIDAVYASM